MRFSTYSLALALVMAPAVADAQGNKAQSDGVQIGFTSAEQHVIEVYFRSNPTSVQPLPPGIVKRLRARETAPAGDRQAAVACGVGNAKCHPGTTASNSRSRSLGIASSCSRRVA